MSPNGYFWYDPHPMYASEPMPLLLSSPFGLMPERKKPRIERKKT